MNTRSFPVEGIASRILVVRGRKVMLDADLADLYGVPTKVLVQAAKRNRNRFPQDFMFQLTEQEVAILRSQIGEGSSFSVEEGTVAGDLRPHPNESGSPEQHGSRVRTGATASEHFPKKASHRFNGICGPRNAEKRVLEV